MPTDPATQHEHFAQGVKLLGGINPAAEVLGVNRRTIERLLSLKMVLHEGYLADMAKALIAHADACRALEKKLNPLFSGNLFDGQPTDDRRGSR